MIARVVRDFGGIRIATTDWPVLFMDLPPPRVADESLVEALAYIEELMRASEKVGDKYFQVTDLTRIRDLPPASQRQHVGDWMQRTLKLQKTATVGGANVTPGAILRGIITAISWFQSAPMPTAFVATRREAVQIGVKALDAANVPLGHEVRERLLARRSERP
ncbi:MAG TPA: hypothetical protein VGI39_35040 [Polyangiaceae bacterium]